MSLIQRIANTVGKQSRAYVCRYCSLSFERERRNCPACGCGPIEPDR